MEAKLQLWGKEANGFEGMSSPPRLGERVASRFAQSNDHDVL